MSAQKRRSTTAALREERILAAVLSQPTITRAAAAAGVNEKTIRRALKRPGFARRVAEARRTAVELAVASLASLAGEAHDALQRNLTCGSPGVEVRAATVVKEGIIRGNEHLNAMKELDELREQVEALQEAQQQAAEVKANDQ